MDERHSKDGKLLPIETCWNCGHKLDCATPLGNEDRPQPGDVSICIECAHINIYATNMSLREPNEAERKEVMCDKHVQKAISLILSRKEK